MPDTYILFELAGTTYALPSSRVQQVDMIEVITPVPNAPPYVEGIVFARGQVIPAVSLRARFGLEKIPHDLRTRLIVATTGGRVVGLIVDSAREFVAIPPEALQPPPEAIPAPSRKCLAGVAALGGRLILILDIEAVLEGAVADLPIGSAT